MQIIIDIPDKDIGQGGGSHATDRDADMPVLQGKAYAT